MFDSGRRSHGPGNRGPDRLAFAWKPGQPDIGLDFKSGIVVMLEFCAQIKVKPVLDQGQIVLQKSAE